MTIKLTLATAGYNVIEAANGADGVRACDSQAVHLVLTDLNMPGLDGLEVIRQIRAKPSHKFTPILMITTESQETKKTAGKAAGATGWIIKPFQPDKLIAVAQKVCPP